MNSVHVAQYIQEIKVVWRLYNIYSPVEGERYNGFYVSDILHFADTTWRLLLVSELADDPETARFTFMFIDSCKYRVAYNFFLKNPDGSLEQLAFGSMESAQKECKNHYIKLKQILQQRPEYASLNVIKIVGMLRAGKLPSIEPKRKKLKKLDTLSENFHNLFTDQLSCDVTLHVKDKLYKVHKAVLIARSTVFAAMFQHDTSEKQTGIVNVSDSDPDSFQDFLVFLYCGKLENLTYSTALNLYVTSEKYNVQELKSFCREYLMENLALDVWCDVYIMANLYEDKKLLSATEVFFHKNLLQIFKSSEWEHFLKENHELTCKLLKEIPGDRIVK